MDLTAIAALLSAIRVFKYLRMNTQMYFLWKVLGRAWHELIAFSTMLVILLAGYSVCTAFNCAVCLAGDSMSQ